MMIYLINQGTLLCLSCFFQLKVSVCVLVLVSSILALFTWYQISIKICTEKC